MSHVSSSLLRPLCTMDGILTHSDKSQLQDVIGYCYISILISCFSSIILIIKSDKVLFSIATHGFLFAVLLLAIDSPTNQIVVFTDTVCWPLAWYGKENGNHTSTSSFVTFHLPSSLDTGSTLLHGREMSKMS